MRPIPRAKFFASYRATFCSPTHPLTQSQVDGIETLLSALEADTHITDIRHAAYMLATTMHETAKTWRPIAEYGRGKGYKYGKPDSVTGRVYYGRGYVQLTHKGNYRAMGAVFGVDLVNNPDLALDPAIAYKIMSYGMRHGTFTGVGLSRYIHGDVCDYVSARRIINGTDVAERVAGYAVGLEAALRAATEVES